MQNLLENSNVFDIETDGLKATKIHCIVDQQGNKLTHYDDMREWVAEQTHLVGHNIISYDIPNLERILGVKVEARLTDTLVLSWYLFSNKVLHGLESWGEEFGVPKPKIDDWENLTTKEYLHRCSEDVKINTKLWGRLYKRLERLYGDDKQISRVVAYLSFKMSCVATQERLGWKLNVEESLNLEDVLSKEVEEKKAELESVMPKVPVYGKCNKPKKPYKMNGELSTSGEKWFKLLDDNNLPKEHSEPVKYVSKYKEPNAGGSAQVKSWLFSLGWTPATFKYVKDKATGETRAIPQINKSGELCPSVQSLSKKAVEVDALGGFSVSTHRLGCVKAMLDDVDDEGYVRATAGGLTNTFRLKHKKPIVNLPAVDKPWGKEIRGLLTCPKGYELLGSDMVALEDRTKQHYLMPHDPEYVEKMMVEGYCPHVDIAVLAGMLTKEEEQRHITGKFIDEADEKYIKSKRKAAKPVNYGGVYGIGAEGLSKQTGESVSFCTKLLKTYWERNWAVKAIAEEQVTKKAFGKSWLQNPISGFWHELRSEKDRFSTLNQGSGVYGFDTWISYLTKRRPDIVCQYHDEIVILKPIEESRDRWTEDLKWAIRKTNKKLKLNRELDIDVQFGQSYADIH